MTMLERPTSGTAFHEPIPPPFLTVRVQRLDLTPTLTALCAGYEGGEWRAKALADHMMEWLPEFALNYNERQAFGPSNGVRLLREAAQRVYTTKKFANRGEFGELLLHIAARQVFNTLPAISKIYYKDADNDTVKGFDSVHVLATPTTLELWVGEVKFYQDISAAISDVVQELGAHTAPGYLRREAAAITNKIEPTWPHADRLKKLLDQNTSLDQVFDAMVIPVLLTYNSDAVNAHQRATEEFHAAFQAEVEAHHRTFGRKTLPPLRVHLFLVPLKDKQELLKHLDEGLRRWQTL
jgi:hypothetical protein